jgi:hypothetical protein
MKLHGYWKYDKLKGRWTTEVGFWKKLTAAMYRTIETENGVECGPLFSLEIPNHPKCKKGKK